MLGDIQISIRVWVLPFGFVYPISANSIPVRIFCYFNLDFGSGFPNQVRIRVRISNIVPKPNFTLAGSCKLFILYLQLY